MASSVEYLVEAQAMALLAANGDLSAVDIKHQQDDTNSASTVSRIIVACADKTPAFQSRNASKVPLMYEAQVTVEGRGNIAASTMDGWFAAMDLAISGQVSGNVRFFPATGGSVATGPNDRRETTRTYKALFAATL